MMPHIKIILNVGGEIFITYASNLDRYPGTRLYELSDSDPAYDSTRGEYFFDRSAHLFPYILDFYRTGELHFPQCVCIPFVKKELAFWRIAEENISSCCWRNYKQCEEEVDTLKEIEETFRRYARTASNDTGRVESAKNRYNTKSNGWSFYCRKVYIFLEDPSSSLAARVWSFLYMALLIVSISLVCMETHHLFRVPSVNLPNVNLTGITNPKLLLHLTTEPHRALTSIDIFCAFLFFVELLVRFIVWPGKLTFFTTFFNIIDLCAISPYMVNTVVHIIDPWFWAEHNINVAFLFLSISSVFRSIRILKLVKHNRGLQVIYLAIKASLREILLLLLLVSIGMLVFSTVIYYAEFSNEENFENIPVGFWWVIITMTTVGYGDKVPTSPLGYVIGSCCALTGMIVTGLPIPVIANSFHLYYTYATTNNKKRSKNARTSSHPLCGRTSSKYTLKLEHVKGESGEIQQSSL